MKISRRKLLSSTVALSTAGVGVTVSQGIDAATTGSVDVSSEQAFIIESVNVANTNTEFTRISDDKTSFQVAVEVVNGADFEVTPHIHNGSSNPLAAEFKFSVADDVTISDVSRENGALQEAVQTNDNTWITEIDGDTTAEPTLDFSVADTATPGSRDLKASVRPLSTND